MKLLVISPDYVSHARPMLEVAREWQRGMGEVVFATGVATRPLVIEAGIAWQELRLGKGSNAGIIDASAQPPGEDEHLRAFFAATRAGPFATLRYQAEARRHDLLHEPDRVLDRIAEILHANRPDRVVVDHVAFGARLALHALGVRAATMVLGHPSALPAAGEIYGLPPHWPASLRPTDAEIAILHAACERSVAELQTVARELLARRATARQSLGDLTTEPGYPTIYVYPASLHEPERALPTLHAFIGHLVRDESLGEVSLPSGVGPRVTVALGSFLGARDDVLATAVRAEHDATFRLALAHGSTAVERLGPLPLGALVAHQFAGAAAIERTGLGVVLAPNGLTAGALAAAVATVLRDGSPTRARALAASLADAGAARPTWATTRIA